MTAMLDRGMRWDYPAIAGVKADLLLVTHEHLDHNGVEAGDGHAALDRRAPRVADLVVLGRSGGGTDGSSVGSVIHAVLHHAHGPVAVVPG